MSLSTALNIAQSSLRTLTRQTSVLSTNIANANNTDYTRRTGLIESAGPGVNFVSVRRNTSDAVFTSSLKAQSDSEAQSTIAGRVSTLQADLLGTDDALSLQSYLSGFQVALQDFAASPSNHQVAAFAVSAAQSLADRINEVASSVQSFRTNVDGEIADSVDQLNSLLSEFEQVNNDVVNGTRRGADVSDQFDKRDQLLKEISRYVPLQTMQRRDNDLVLMTRGGATLFETVPRTITFDASTALAAGVSGNPVLVDGVPLLGGTTANSQASGRIAGLLQLRDAFAPTIQNQVDEFARQLISAFSETDQSGSGLPALAGLFTYAGGPALPASGTVAAGISTSFALNPLFDPDQGGNPLLLRDGGANGAPYLENSAGDASFSSRIIGWMDALTASNSFDASTGIGSQMSIEQFSSEITGWLDGYRSSAREAADSKSALSVRLQETLSNETGVNVDEEMSKLLDLEHSYEASARIISAIDNMLSTLIESVR